MAKLTSFTDDALILLDNVVDYSTSLRTPTIRLGVTGLSRSGKTVFITALVHSLLNGSPLPMFRPVAEGRVSGTKLEPQPSMNLPRFSYEDHLKLLTREQVWPSSTSTISELRLTVAYESASTWNRTLGSGKLNIDIVDYPGEWLLDLPLLAMDFNQWSKQALDLSRLENRSALAEKWHKKLGKIDGNAPFVETEAIELAQLFTEYLHACRDDKKALSTLPPGRFLMPGDLEGSPALTFCPLPPENEVQEGSYLDHMSKRFEAYKNIVIKPFFREHFARLDRQIILVDALQAMNAGTDAVVDLENALAEILDCFNPGQNNWLTSIFTRRIDKILFAATKVDHLHRENHKNLENLLRKLVDNASKKAKFAGAEVDVLAMASLRSTREASISDQGEELPVIMGTPIEGEVIEGTRFDGKTETAVFPGDIPGNADLLFDPVEAQKHANLSFVRFRPPKISGGGSNVTVDLPHIRLDRALQFLLADYLA